MIHNRLMGQTTMGNKGCGGCPNFVIFIKIYLKRTFELLLFGYYGQHYDDFRTKCLANSNKMDR